MRHDDGLVESLLHGFQIDGGVPRPGKGDGREGLGNEEAVPRAQLPGAVGQSVVGSDPGGVDELCELHNAGLRNHVGPAGTVGGNGGAMACLVGFGHVAQTECAATRRRAADGKEAEILDGAGDEFAVEGRRDEDGDSLVPEAVSAGEQRAVPEGEDDGAGDFDADGDVRRVDVAVAPGASEQADEENRDGRDDREEDSLLEREALHGVKCSWRRSMGVCGWCSLKRFEPRRWDLDAVACWAAWGEGTRCVQCLQRGMPG